MASDHLPISNDSCEKDSAFHNTIAEAMTKTKKLSVNFFILINPFSLFMLPPDLLPTYCSDASRNHQSQNLNNKYLSYP